MRLFADSFTVGLVLASRLSCWGAVELPHFILEDFIGPFVALNPMAGVKNRHEVI